MYTLPGIIGLLVLFLSMYLLFLSVWTLVERPVRYGVFLKRTGVALLALFIGTYLVYYGMSLEHQS